MEGIKKNKILLVIFFITLIAFVYYFFFSGSSGSTDISLNASSTDVTTSQDILDMLQKVDTIKIDDTLFSGTLWSSLRDLSATLPTNTPGRTDLFGPIGQTGSAAVSTSKTAR